MACNCNCNKKSAAQKYNFATQDLTTTPAPLNMGATAGLPTGPAVRDGGNNIGIARTGLYRLTAQLIAAVTTAGGRRHAERPGLLQRRGSGLYAEIHPCSRGKHGDQPGQSAVSGRPQRLQLRRSGIPHRHLCLGLQRRSGKRILRNGERTEGGLV